MRERLRVTGRIVPVLLLAGGCDGLPTEVPEEKIRPASVFGVRLDCMVDVGDGSFFCEPASSETPDGLSAAVVGSQDRFVRLTGSNTTVSSGVLSTDVTVQNLTLQPLATADGTTPDPNGVRVFFHTMPTGTVEVANADGTGTFTAANQPFHQYDETPSRLGGDGILSAANAETSGAKNWEFTLNGDTSFSFSVFVDAVVPDANGIAVSLAEIWPGTLHSCGRTLGDQAYCWGGNLDGQIGDGTTTDRLTPVPVDQTVDGGVMFVQATPGHSHSCGVTTASQAYCWGRNREGQLGDGTTFDRLRPVKVDQTVDGGITFDRVFLGVGDHTCATTPVGQAYCWGFNSQGQLGNGSTTDTNQPVAVDQTVDGGITFFVLSLGGSHTCGLTSSGQAYCWGDNTDGRLGDGTTTDRLRPVKVDQTVDGGLNFAEIAAAGSHTCGLTTEGQTYCWGSNSSGQLGDGSATNSSTPVQVDQSVHGGVSFQSVVAGNSHTCGLTSGGQAYCWGLNRQGQLGNGSTTDSSLPVAVDQTVDGGINIEFLSALSAAGHTCALTDSGPAYCWGSNRRGKLGDGTTTNRLVPTVVASTQ